MRRGQFNCLWSVMTFDDNFIEGCFGDVEYVAVTANLPQKPFAHNNNYKIFSPLTFSHGSGHTILRSVPFPSIKIGCRNLNSTRQFANMSLLKLKQHIVCKHVQWNLRTMDIAKLQNMFRCGFSAECNGTVIHRKPSSQKFCKLETEISGSE